MPDIILTITIPAAKAIAFRDDFLAVCPIPPGSNMTAPQWIRKCVLDNLNELRKSGARIRFEQNLQRQMDEQRNGQTPPGDDAQ